MRDIEPGRAEKIPEELTSVSAQLIAHEPVRTVGQLALGMAHDLANVIAALLLRVQTLKLRKELPAALIAEVSALERSVGEARLLLEDIQVLGRPPARTIGTVALGRTIKRAVDLAESALRVRAALSGACFAVDARVGRLPKVRGDEADLRRVFVNLLINASQAMPAGGTVSLRSVVRSDAVVLTFADQGTGIPPEVMPRLFDPFFTTKGANGLGLGLAMAREIVERAGGRIRARNRRGGGAVFEVRLVRRGR